MILFVKQKAESKINEFCGTGQERGLTADNLFLNECNTWACKRTA